MAKFNFTSDGKILHLVSGLCAHLNVCGKKCYEGFFNLKDCNQNSTRLHYFAGDRDFEGKETEVIIKHCFYGNSLPYFYS